MCSHFLPRNIVIFTSRILIDCQLSECLQSRQVISQLFSYWWCCRTRDVSFACALGAVSLHMDPKERLAFSDIPLIHPEGSWSRRHEDLCLCLLPEWGTSSHPTSGIFCRKPDHPVHCQNFSILHFCCLISTKSPYTIIIAANIYLSVLSVWQVCQHYSKCWG